MAGNTIVLKGMGHHDEGRLDAVVSPGMWIEMAADGEYDLIQATKAETLKGVAGKKLVKEDALRGKTVTDAYAINDVVFFYIPLPGDIVQVLIKDGQAIAVGDTLVPEANGSGLTTEAAGTETAYWLEALEAATPSGANVLISARVL